MVIKNRSLQPPKSGQKLTINLHKNPRLRGMNHHHQTKVLLVWETNHLFIWTCNRRKCGDCCCTSILTCPFDRVIDRADGVVVVNHVTCLSLPRHVTGHRQLRGLGALPLCHTRGTAYVITARADHALTVSDVLRTVVARGRLT